jgi:hypothetical protein
MTVPVFLLPVNSSGRKAPMKHYKETSNKTSSFGLLAEEKGERPKSYAGSDERLHTRLPS